jgi:hypothetical protein
MHNLAESGRSAALRKKSVFLPTKNYEAKASCDFRKTKPGQKHGFQAKSAQLPLSIHHNFGIQETYIRVNNRLHKSM